MCKCLEVSRSGYYEWCDRPLSLRAKENEKISEKIKIIFINGRRNYGTRRIKRGLGKEGLNISRRRIGYLMSEMKLLCKTKCKFRVTTDSKHTMPVVDNVLNREFKVNKPDQYYVGDITYIHTQVGWVYLAIVIVKYYSNMVLNKA